MTATDGQRLANIENAILSMKGDIGEIKGKVSNLACDSHVKQIDQVRADMENMKDVLAKRNFLSGVISAMTAGLMMTAKWIARMLSNGGP